MNIELKPIAEKKIEQLGGDVCGVLVRTDDGEVMAVSEHGRCTRLDAGVMGPVETEARESLFSERDLFLMKEAMNAGQYYESLEDWLGEVISDGGHTVEQHLAHDADQKQAARAQGGQGAEPVALLRREIGESSWFDHTPVKPNTKEAYALKSSPILDYCEVYTQPQPAVPEGIEVAIGMLEDYASALGNGDLDGVGHSTTQAIYEAISLLSTTPQSDGWVKCEDRLPTEADEDHEGRVWLCWPDRKLVERVTRRTASFCDGFWWMPTGLKRPQPPKQEGGQ